ncbi:DUF732 domain-containing protein [Dactylosporangium sp. CA-092794]|uniref:DUF732 domain-containing protein n=1 Tax=Dactylosporangium sp. CA-092794 TaxID=3239929 RepID=UPI003D91CB2E
MPGPLARPAARARSVPGGRRAAIGAGVLVALVMAGVLWWSLRDDSGRSGGYPTGLVPSAPAPATAPTSASGTGPTGPTGSAPTGSAPAGGGSARPVVTGGTDPAGRAATAFLTELGAIDPALASDPGQALAGGQAACQDLAAHQPDETVLGNVTRRFRLGAGAADRAKAALIVDAAHNHLCP